MRRNYGEVIKESAYELEKLEAKHRNSVIGTRMRMLKLLKTGQATSLQQVAKQLHYSLRQTQRWLKMYQLSGLPGLLAPLKAATGGVPERMTAEAWEALDKALANSEIGSYKQARHLLAQHGVVYKDDSSIHRLFKRHQIKAKTGRARHEKADVETQDAFKKTLQLP